MKHASCHNGFGFCTKIHLTEGRMGEIRRFRMTRDYFTTDGLETLAGVCDYEYETFILKELVDNALDATENRETRKIDVRFTPSGGMERLSVFDNGPGISGRLLDQIYTQFDSYLSSKKGYRTPTRGYQGNALKTVIGICALNGFELALLTREGETLTYTPDHRLSGEVGFRRASLGPADGHGVSVTGCFSDLSEQDIVVALEKYHLCNPDVYFSFNDREFAAIVPAVRRKETSYISWYDLPAFEELITSSAYISPEEHTFDFTGDQIKNAIRLYGQIACDLSLVLYEEPLTWLNRLLELPDLIDKCRKKGFTFVPSAEIETLEALTSGMRREAFERLGDAEKGYIKWLNRALLEAIYTRQIRRSPRTTVRAFLESHFSQVQKIVKHLAVSGMTLTDLAADKDKIASLFFDLHHLVKPPRDQILKPYLTGEENLKKLLNDGTYKACFDHYEIHNRSGDRSAITRVPFAIEAFLVKADKTPFAKGARIIIAVNNSIPSERDPFRFHRSDTPSMRSDAIAVLRREVQKRFSLQNDAEGPEWLNAILEDRKFCTVWLEKVCDFVDEEVPAGGDRIITDLEQKSGLHFGGTVRERVNACLRETALYTRLGEPPLPPEMRPLARDTAEYRQKSFAVLTPLAQLAVKEFNAALLHALYPSIPQRKRLSLGKEVAGLIQETEATRLGRTFMFPDEQGPLIRLNRLLLGATFGDLGTSHEGYSDLSGFLADRGLGREHLLYVSLICPVIQVTDKAKTSIIADPFKARLFSTVSLVLKSLPKVKKRGPSVPTDKELMRHYLRPAYDHASSNGKYLVMARQLYYPLRDLINREAGVTLTEASYNAFTQKRITEFFEEFPEYENKILFERRGSFKSPFGSELLLGTADVTRFVQARYANKVKVLTETKMRTLYDFSPQYLYNRVLFVEKGGYRDILEEAGLLRKLNMGIMSTQGFGTRAGKEVVRTLRRLGIEVYVLHDCDIPGHQIMHNLLKGSQTFKAPLDVNELGLTVTQVQQLREERRKNNETGPDGEIVPYAKSFEHSLQTLIATEEARRFFTPTEEEIRKMVGRASQERARHYYKRVEINALTSEELIVLIEREIFRIEKEKGLAQPEPGAGELKSFLSEIGGSDVLEEIKKRAIYKVFKDRAAVRIDPEAIIRLVLARMKDRPDGGGHWTSCLGQAIEEYMEKLVEELAEELKRTLPDSTGI